MTDIPDDHTVPSVIDSALGGLPDESSLLDALAQQREETASTRETYIPVWTAQEKGYTLYAQYRLLDAPELERIAKKIQREFKKPFDRNFYGSLDVISDACVGFAVDLGDGEKITLTLRGAPITGYDQNLAEALKFQTLVNEQKPARSIVSALFGGNVIAIQQHNLMLGRWMGNTTIDVTQEFMDAGGNL